jgi:tetratricopeptide (TPR) repeat protein
MTVVVAMKTPRQYLSERYPWLNLTDSLAVALVLVLIVVAVFPHSRLVIDLVLVTAIPGSIAAIVWSLTFWQKGRVQIGRLKLRYKWVRRIAGIAALLCLPFLLLQQASIYLRGPNILREPAVDVSGLTEPYPKPAKWEIRVIVAIAHLEGDDGHKVEGQLRDALAKMDPRLHVTPVILNRTITLKGRTQGMAHLDALTSVTDVRVESLIWGGVKGAPSPAVGPLYDTEFSDYPQFGGGYLPGDFKLPELPPDDLVKVLRLVIATDSAEFMSVNRIKFGDALVPLIGEAREMLNDHSKTAGWSSDTRARANLVLGMATRFSGVELKSKDSLNASVEYIQHALDDWTHDRDPLEWAMAQRNLGRTLCDKANLNMDTTLLRPAVAAFQNAMLVYQSRSDRIDVAEIQSQLGILFEVIGRYEPGRENLRKAVEYYRAALNGIDPRKFPNIWGETQIQLGNALRVLSFWDNGTKDIEDAIAANREALKVYPKQDSPMHWAQAQGQIAESLSQLAQLAASAEDFRQSISLLRQILNGYPREQKPIEWAGLQSALGDALMGLYDLDPKSGTKYPEQAAIVYRASLQELTLEREPIAWAQAKQGLGNALEELGYNNSNRDYLNQAIDAYNDALKVWKSDQQPLQWATVKYELGLAYVYLGEQGPGVKFIQQGVQNYREALAALHEGDPPELRKDIQDNLNAALEDLHQRGWNGG